MISSIVLQHCREEEKNKKKTNGQMVLLKTKKKKENPSKNQTKKKFCTTRETINRINNPQMWRKYWQTIHLRKQYPYFIRISSNSVVSKHN
jgi:hypothetical protein